MSSEETVVNEGVDAKKVKSKASLKQEKSNSKEVFIYIGATIQNVVQTNTVFSNGLSQALKEKIKDYPFLSELVVPVSQIVTMKQQLKDDNSSLSIFYKKSMSVK